MVEDFKTEIRKYLSSGEREYKLIVITKSFQPNLQMKLKLKN